MTRLAGLIESVKLKVGQVTRFVKEDVWEVDLEELSKTKARLVRDIQIVSDALATFTQQKIGFQSVALSYFCTMSVIPFVAVAFAITQGFGLAGKLSEFLYSLDIGQDIIDWILAGAGNIIDSARSGGFGLLSALMFVWLVVWMMNRVEKVFNNVWNVKTPERSFWKSLGTDLAILFLSPFLILIFFSGSVVYSHVLDLFPNWLGISEVIKSFLGWVIFCTVSVMTLSVMFKFIPAVVVKYRYALKAALLSGVAFTILQFLYLETQVMVIRINAVYGTLAIIPLFMVWLRMGWLIVLLGAQFSCSFQTSAEGQVNVRP